MPTTRPIRRPTPSPRSVFDNPGSPSTRSRLIIVPRFLWSAICSANTTKATGTGLGMPMVFKIIKEFSGEIRVESKEGVGSRISIFLPMPQKNKKLLTQNGD